MDMSFFFFGGFGGRRRREGGGREKRVAWRGEVKRAPRLLLVGLVGTITCESTSGGHTDNGCHPNGERVCCSVEAPSS